jgi:hypothetical protein
MGKQITPELMSQVMAAIGSKGGKRSLKTMTPEERSARAKKASIAAAKKRTEKRLAQQKKSKPAKKKAKRK